MTTEMEVKALLRVGNSGKGVTVSFRVVFGEKGIKILLRVVRTAAEARTRVLSRVPQSAEAKEESGGARQRNREGKKAEMGMIVQ